MNDFISWKNLEDYSPLHYLLSAFWKKLWRLAKLTGSCVSITHSLHKEFPYTMYLRCVHLNKSNCIAVPYGEEVGSDYACFDVMILWPSRNLSLRFMLSTAEPLCAANISHLNFFVSAFKPFCKAGTNVVALDSILSVPCQSEGTNSFQEMHLSVSLMAFYKQYLCRIALQRRTHSAHPGKVWPCRIFKYSSWQRAPQEVSKMFWTRIWKEFQHISESHHTEFSVWLMITSWLTWNCTVLLKRLYTGCICFIEPSRPVLSTHVLARDGWSRFCTTLSPLWARYESFEDLFRKYSLHARYF